MTKKQQWFLPILLLLIISLTGCSSLEAEAEPLEPLNRAEWPTPEPTAPAASPTSFPQVKLVAAATATPLAVATATATPAAVTEASSTGNVVTQVNSGLYAPVAAAFVTADNATIYRQPGTSAVGVIEKSELVGVLDQNAGGDWLYVLTTSQVQGWLPKTALRITGTLEKAPVLPPDPLQTAPAATAGPDVSANNSPTALADLKPIATAQVVSDGLNMRQGPGATYDHVETLAQNDQVSILAINPRKDWALVETSTGQQGWVSLAYLQVQGDVTRAPVVTASAGQQPLIPAAQGSSAGSVPQAEPVSFKSNPAQATSYSLETVATARIARSEVYVRPGPSAEYAGIDKLTNNQEQLSILALDQSRTWALIQPTFAHIGWVALDDLTLEGSVAEAPSVFTAWVESNAIEVRSGPGIFHEQTGQLAINSLVQALGLDDSRSWALIQPIPGGSLGWSQIQFLKNIGQPWAKVPLAPELPAPTQAAATPEPFTPARPVSQSKIVFQRSSGGDIMVINPDGSGLRRLTSGIDPVLSPDGQTVAFTRWEGETGSLWLINTDGSNERQVFGFIKQAKGPDWSPDGSQIVLNFQDGGRVDSKTVCTRPEDGKQPNLPRGATNVKVKLDDDGAKLCWSTPPDPHWGLRVINLADGSFKDVDGGTYAFRPAWDPGQSWRIVTDGGRGLLATDLTQDKRQTITDEINDGSPVFSPDGRYLAVTSGQEGSGAGYNIYRLNADGSGRVQLTQTPLWVTVQPDEAKAWNNVAPAWSPDASQIAFLTDHTGRWEIWVMNADGSDPHALFSDEVNNQLELTYNFVDERVLSWR